MGIGTISMILANVGLSIFNNWAGSRQNKQIAAKREEFERAAREGQRERMLQLMREGQQLTLELEEQKHKERLSELNDQFDNLIKELAYSAAIEHWPLKTLPIVMKNQALGNLLGYQDDKEGLEYQVETVALHCILTPSNCREFNDYVLPKVESALEAYCNVYWNALTGSPVLFYSGAWKANDVPTGTQVDSMRAALSNLPTLLITPFFRPQDHKLVFQTHVWGVGYNNSDLFTIPEIDPSKEPKSEKMEQSDTKRIRFQRDYTDELKWLAEDGLIEEAVEDLVPYLQCLIGYIADTYFWSAFGSVPQLPRMLADGTINTDGMKYLVDDTREYYDNLLLEGHDKAKKQPFVEYNLLSLVEGVEDITNTNELQTKFGQVLSLYCLRKYGKEYTNINDIIEKQRFDYSDIDFLKELSQHLNSNERIPEIINKIQNSWISVQSIDFCKYCEIEVDKYDIVQMLDKFLYYIESADNISRDEIALYIKHKKFKTFIFAVYNTYNKKILNNDSFCYRVRTKALVHSKQIKTIFKYQEEGELICRYYRISSLRDKILDDTLIF